ncbi:MAG TPA: type II toxin-antitoxin system VapC family toxin [Anaerolineales bacterium]|nr:type II toxin-antitoxin system VapC family toxin [Anaerolineales bacterium]
MNVVDSSAWLEYLSDGPNAKVFSAVIEATTKLVVPVVTIYEVYKKVKLEIGEDKAIEAVAVMSRGKVVDVDVSVALEAADVSLSEQIPMADSMILATARLYQATLWTQDAHFDGLAGVKFIKKR